MPALQTTYSPTHAVAYVGMEADAESAGYRNVSRTVETAAVGFGVAVSQGANDHGIVAFSGANSKFLGVTVRDHAVDPSSPDAFRVGDTAAVKERGSIWVAAGAPVVAGDPVYLTSAGAFTNIASGNTAVSGSIFRTTAASGALAKIRL